jgi:mannan endo-1,4-beta-mannosidase
VRTTRPTLSFESFLISFGQIDVDTIPDAGSYLLLIKDGKTTINTGPNGIQRLDTIIALAKKYNIRVHFTLTNNWFPFVDDSSPSFPRNFLSSDYGQYLIFVQSCELVVNWMFHRWYGPLR